MGSINIVFGWCWMIFGILSGMVMGLWAEKESWLGGYDSITRRYLRLAHVAFFALSIINILYGREINILKLSLFHESIGSILMIFAAVGISLGCAIAAFYRPMKYFLPLPALAFLIANIILVIGLLSK